MKIYTEQSLRDFQFWSGAKDFAETLTDEQFDQIEAILEDLYPDGMTDTQINDLFWFEEETIREWLDLPTEEQEEANQEIERWEDINPDFVEWVLDEYFSIGARDDMSQWEDIVDYLDDESIQQEFEESRGDNDE